MNDLTDEQRELVVKNSKLVYFTAYKNFRSMAWDEDLISAGNIGLLQAAQLFDPDRGYKFSTYAHKAILREMVEYIKKQRKVTGNEFTFKNEENVFEMCFGSREENQEVRIDIKNALGKLSQHEQAIVRYRMDGVTFREIAQKMHRKSKQSIQYNYAIALRKMRDILEYGGAEK